jgi:hypothetical protein
MNTVAIGYCHNGMVHQPWMECVLATQTAHPHLVEGTISASGAYIAQNRNRVVQRFLDEAQSQYLWFLDYDIIFAPETLPWLLKAANENGPGMYAALYFVSLRGGLRATWLKEDWTPVDVFTETLTPLGFVAMGCTLIHREILAATKNEEDPWPWFGHDIMDTPTGLERMSEDYGFCQRARDKGYRIWGVPIGLGHIKTQVLDFDLYMKEKQHALGQDGAR